MKIKILLQFVPASCFFVILMLCSHNELAYGFEVTTTNRDGSGPEIHWSTPSAGFYINSSGFPSGSITAIQAAMQTWTDVSTSNFSFIYRGMTTSTAYAQNDGTNIISFGALGSAYTSTLALNTFWYTVQGELLDSDIKFNENFAWATDGSAGAYDIQSIGLHELGHALSLDDLYGADQEFRAMYYLFSKGQIKRSLTQDDKNGISYLYGGGSATTTTTTVPSSTTTTIIQSSCPAETVLGQDNPDLENLRAFRDGPLARSAVGRKLTRIYYEKAESINAALERSPSMQALARRFLEALALLVTKIE